MARILLASAGDAAAVVGQPWFVVLCMAVASVLIVSFAVFLCSHSSGVHDEDLPKKKPTKPSSTKVRSMAGRSGTVVDTTGMYTAAYGVAVVGGCSGGHGGHGGHGCSGCGGGGGGGGGCGGGGGGGGCGGGGGGGGC